MAKIYLYVENQKRASYVCEQVRSIEAIGDLTLVPESSTLYEIKTKQGFDSLSIKACNEPSGCISRPLGDENHVVVLSVDGMTCNSCVKLIETTVGQMEGIHNIKVSLSQSEAFIEYHPATMTAEKLSTAIYDMGFDASVKIILDSSKAIASSEVTVNVVGMVCMSCVNNIETNIGKMDGVVSVKASLQHNTATIHYNSAKVTPQALCSAIEDLGFDASLSARPSPITRTVCVGVEGMTCNSCVKLIESTVGSKEGIVKISVSLAKKEAMVEYDQTVLNDDVVRNSIDDMGFEVTYVNGEMYIQHNFVMRFVL